MGDGLSMNDFTGEDRAWIVGMVYQRIAEYFAHWEDAAYGREQLDEVYRETLHEALAAENRREFVTVLMRWIGMLRNGHTRCLDLDWQGTSLGFRLERLDEGWVVTSSAVDAVAVGDIVAAIDGLSPAQWMMQASPYLTGKRPGVREAEWQHFVPFWWDASEAVLRVRGRDDRVRTVSYRPVPFRVGRSDRPAHTTGRWLREGEVAYIRIPSFGEPHYETEALAYVRQFTTARAIIVDVRHNDGGTTPSALTAALMDRPYRWWTETAPNIGHLRRRHPGNPQFRILPDGSGARCDGAWEPPAAGAYRGQIVALADRYAGSAAEDFLMPFKDTKRAVLVGEATWGSTGQPVFVRHGSLQVSIGSVRAILPDDTPFEGVGIAPDVAIASSREALCSGRDAVLEGALNTVLW